MEMIVYLIIAFKDRLFFNFEKEKHLPDISSTIATRKSTRINEVCTHQCGKRWELTK